MKKAKGISLVVARLKFVNILFALVGLYLVLMGIGAPRLFKPRSVSILRPSALEVLDDNFTNLPNQQGPLKAEKHVADSVLTGDGTLYKDISEYVKNDADAKVYQGSLPRRLSNELPASWAEDPDKHDDLKKFGGTSLPGKVKESLSSFQRAIDEARYEGAKSLQEVERALKSETRSIGSPVTRIEVDDCPKSVIFSAEQMQKAGNKMVFPCGLTAGSTVTVIGRPKAAHIEHMPQIARIVEGVPDILVSQFMLELQGLKVVDNEDPPRILHVNPRIHGDWSEKSVIELNTCYRGQWGIAQRCEGWQSPDTEEKVDGLFRCEKWLREDWASQEEFKTSWWLNKITGRSEKSSGDWQYPFREESVFVLSIRAGWQGYHITVDGMHIASFPYRTGFVLEEATGFTVAGDIELNSVVATSLPLSHPNNAPAFVLEDAARWRAPRILHSHVVLFIGILSSSTHFVERMAVRKTWMQSNLIKSSNVVVRFFVGLHGNKDINIQVRKEADLFGDMVILPFIDHYELVVLKTVAICDFGIRNVSARHIMKTDDDTFVRVDAIIHGIKEYQHESGLYMGNINWLHKPLRFGKWAVTYEEWPEEEYPPYCDGPGYIISIDIAKFITSLYNKGSLRLFKMEDVSMGLWVIQFNQSHPIHYIHSPGFCQWGCANDYYIAHYQSPRQMLCLWEKLSQGIPECCNL